MSDHHVSVQGLRFAYPGGRPVLDGLELDVPPGRALALLGSNGCGKTTLLRCLAGSLRPSHGAVLVDGRPVEHSRNGLRRHRETVQLVLQDPDDQLFSASVGQDVSFGPRNLGLEPEQVRDRVDEALEVMGVEHLRTRATHLLSFGERKRVAIAGAVAMHPCALILDEPTAGLDPVAVDALLRAVARLRESGTTVVLATHDVDLALSWADEVALLVDGRAQQGPPEVLLDDEDLLARARLSRPWALTVGTRLQSLGLLPAGPLPRDAAAMVGALPLPEPPAWKEVLG